MSTSGSDLGARVLLRRMFDAAVDAARPEKVLPRHLPAPARGRTVVVGAGKAAAAMAATVEAHWPRAALDRLSGIVVTRYGHGVPCRRIEVVEASHPIPDRPGVDAAARILDLVQGLTADDLVLALISGGGSALLALPAEGVSLEDKRAVTSALLKSGAAIDEINAVRKHLSAIKGGRLAAAAYPAPVVALAISDVPGDDPSVIASGPTVPDPSRFADARSVLAKYAVAAPASVDRHLRCAADETPKPGDSRLAHSRFVLVATPQASLEAAAGVARRHGIVPVILGDAIEGEAREVARVMAGVALQVARRGQPAAPPCVLLSGGETTVTVRGRGRGGRNQEFLLALALALAAHPAVAAIAGDTDGIDGSESNAGAVVIPDSLARAAALGRDAKRDLADNDGYGFFAALGDLVVTGPTLTNVNDFRAILVASGPFAGH
jgi:hydroxypyruvate reductase